MKNKILFKKVFNFLSFLFISSVILTSLSSCIFLSFLNNISDGDVRQSPINCYGYKYKDDYFEYSNIPHNYIFNNLNSIKDINLFTHFDYDESFFVDNYIVVITYVDKDNVIFLNPGYVHECIGIWKYTDKNNISDEVYYTFIFENKMDSLSIKMKEEGIFDRGYFMTCGINEINILSNNESIIEIKEFE